LNANENVLTFSAPLSRATNTISIYLSAYSTTISANTNYLRVNGTNNMTENLVAKKKIILIIH
jgi:hypothetical protein